MSLPAYAIEGRAHLLARIKLLFDLALALALYLSGAPLVLLLAPAIDILLLIPYLRYVKRSPAFLTFAALGLWAALLALAPLALGANGLALWALFPVLPACAAFALARRSLLWPMAALTMGFLALGILLLVRSQQALNFDLVFLAVLAAANLASIALLTWLTKRFVRAESGSSDLLDQPITVARGVMVIPLNWVVGGVQVERLRQELHEIKRVNNPRWIVLDLAPAGEISSHDLHAIERAAEEVSAAPCTVVLARPPVDAIGHLDVARPVVGRIERFATVAQAVEAGLRRTGWSQQEQGQRVVTTY